MRCGNSSRIAIPSRRVSAGRVSFWGLASSCLFVRASLGGEVRSSLAFTRLDQRRWRVRSGCGCRDAGKRDISIIEASSLSIEAQDLEAGGEIHFT
jgi:hypothetical protein